MYTKDAIASSSSIDKLANSESGVGAVDVGAVEASVVELPLYESGLEVVGRAPMRPGTSPDVLLSSSGLFVHISIMTCESDESSCVFHF